MGVTLNQAHFQDLIKELTLQPELNENSQLIVLTSNELANLLLKVSSDIRSGTPLYRLLENTVKLLGEFGIAESVLLFQLDEGGSKAYLTNYWSSAYMPSFDPVGFQIDLKDSPFKLLQFAKSNIVQVKNFSKYLSLPNYLFRNKYKAMFLKLKTRSILVTLGSSRNVRVVLNLQFSTRDVVWSNEVEKVLQAIVDQLAIAAEKCSEERKKEKLQRSVVQLKEKSLVERDKLLKRFASDVHDLPCTIIPNLRNAIQNKDFSECEKLVDELYINLRQLINEYVVPDINLLGFVNCVYQYVNGFKKSFRGKVFIVLPDEEINLPHKSAIELFKVIKEWFCNIEKHSKATEIYFSVHKLNELYFTITISDNGKGFEVEKARTSGYGILNIENRLKDINAKFEIQGNKGKGAAIRIQGSIS